MVDYGNLKAVDQLHRLQNGRSSISDLGISKLNNHKIERHDEEFANKQLEKLCDKIIGITSKIRKIV